MSLTAFFGSTTRQRSSGSTPPVDEYTYYVDADSGDDGNPGTSAEPFASISVTDALVGPGDSVYVRAGTYRETPKPAASGTAGNEIRYVLERGAIISGLEIIPNTGWTNTSGEIYEKDFALPIANFGGTTSTNTALLANQLFRNGEMMFQASSRALTTFTDLFDLTKWKYRGESPGVNQAAPNFYPTYIIDTALNGLGLAGARVVTLGWFISESRTITSQSGDQINWTGAIFGATDPEADDGVHVRKYYFVTDKLSLLTTEKEWHYDNSSTTLYFRQPGGGTPTGVIEYKARNWGFDLRGREYINIKGGTFIGCEPATGDEDTNYCTLDNARVSYQNHSVTHETTYWQGYGNSRQVGVKFLGTGNIVKNCEFYGAGSQSVWIGTQGKVQNNKFEYIGYDGMWGCPIAFWGIGTPSTSFEDINNILVEYNTASYLGRGAVDFGFAFVEGDVQNVTNHTIRYNNFSHFAMLNQDGGLLYAWGYMNLAGTKVYRNIFHDLAAVKPPDGSLTDGIISPIYWDMASGATVGQDTLDVYENITYNIGDTGGFTSTEVADYYELLKFTYSEKQGSRIYNNTFMGNIRAYYKGEGVVASEIRNNISKQTFNFFFYPALGSVNMDMDYGIIQANPDPGSFPGGIPANVMTNTNPLLTGGDINDPLTYFSLQSGSPARGAGVSLPGYNTSLDLGAIPYGSVAWEFGYSEVAL